MTDTNNKKYPSSVFFILVHQVFERFSFWGIVVILPLFLRNVLHYTDDSSTVLYHGFTLVGYLSAAIGAGLADSRLGKFWTISIFSIPYLIGGAGIVFATLPIMSGIWMSTVSLISLVLIALASGSIKPCIIAFGGDQFILPEQQKLLDSFFPMFYIVVNFTLFMTAIISPILRKDVSCFGQDTCYPLAFVVPFGLVLLSVVVFVLGKRRYRVVKVEENMVSKSFNCIKFAVSKMIKEALSKKQSGKVEHWLDHGQSKFGSEFVQELKRVLSLTLLFLPITVFWALYDQQFSRWTFQASKMNGVIFGYQVKPDQFATLNFIFTFLLIPTFDKIVYPILSKCRISTQPLQRVAAGSTFAALAFIICALVQLRIETLSPSPIPNGESQLVFVNSVDSNVTVEIGPNTLRVPPRDFIKVDGIPAGSSYFEASDPTVGNVSGNLLLHSGKSYTILLYTSGENNDTRKLNSTFSKAPNDLEMSVDSNTKLRIICGGLDGQNLLRLRNKGMEVVYETVCHEEGLDTLEFPVGRYTLSSVRNQSAEETAVTTVHLETGGSYALAVSKESQSIQASLIVLRDPASMSMLWLLPQYFVMSVAEVLVEVPLTGFAYDEAPATMKSLLQVVNLIPPALGGIMVLAFVKSGIFTKLSADFFFFAGLNFGAVIVFIYLSKRYTKSN